jgi:hypothetical protein
MANDISANPWSIDTASATAIWTGNIWIDRLVWHEPTTAGDALEVTDSNGKTIWSKYALAGGSGMDYDLKVDSVFNGLIVPTMSSGTLYVYLEQTQG